MILVMTLLAAALAQPPTSPADAVNARFLELETRLAGALQRKEAAVLDSLPAASLAP
jgi:hypothetical protein